MLQIHTKITFLVETKPKVIIWTQIDAILNRHTFETQQTILKYLPKKAKIKIFDRTPYPTVTTQINNMIRSRTGMLIPNLCLILTWTN